MFSGAAGRSCGGPHGVVVVGHVVVAMGHVVVVVG